MIHRILNTIFLMIIVGSASIAYADPYRKFEDSTITLDGTTLRECFNKQESKIEEVDWYSSRLLSLGVHGNLEITTYEITQKGNRIFLLFRTVDRVFVAVSIHYPNGMTRQLIGNDARGLFTNFCNSE